MPRYTHQLSTTHTPYHTTPRNDTTVRREMEDVSGRLLFARRFVESVVYSSNRKPLLSGIATTRYRAEPSRLPIIPADSFSSFYTAPGR